MKDDGKLPTRVFDLGFAMGKLEEAEDGQPMLTIMTPAYDVASASSTVVNGWDNLRFLGMALMEYCAGYQDARAGDDDGDMDQDD